MIRSAVLKNWHTFSTPLEGRCAHPYLDSKGLLTVAVGNLREPMSTAFGLPWMIGGYAATQQEIVEGLRAVKERGRREPDPNRPGQTRYVYGSPNPDSGGGAFASVTRLRLSNEAIDQIVLSQLNVNDHHLSARFPDYPGWCADAQLFIHSFSWACGSGLDFVATQAIDGIYPKMARCLYEGDFDGAIAECKINPNVGTIIKRNAANRQLLQNAQRVHELGLDPDVLYYPRRLDEEYTPTKPDTIPIPYAHHVEGLPGLDAPEPGTDRIATPEDFRALSSPDLDEDTDPGKDA